MQSWMFNGYLSTQEIIKNQDVFVSRWKPIILRYKLLAHLSDWNELRQELLVFLVRVTERVFTEDFPSKALDVPHQFLSKQLMVEDEDLFREAQSVSRDLLDLIQIEEQQNVEESFLRQNFTLAWMTITILEELES